VASLLLLETPLELPRRIDGFTKVLLEPLA
jgi:hypothetical protein